MLALLYCKEYRRFDEADPIRENAGKYSRLPSLLSFLNPKSDPNCFRGSQAATLLESTSIQRHNKLTVSSI